MDSARLAAAGDVDRGTAFSECASNPFADTATASCDNCYQLIVSAHSCLFASIALNQRPTSGTFSMVISISCTGGAASTASFQTQLRSLDMDDFYAINAAKTEFREGFNLGDVA